MQQQSTGAVKLFAGIAALLGWFAITAQFYLIINGNTAPVSETIIRFFSYFTILSNILVALCFTGILFDPKCLLHRFFSKAGTQTAITAYIMVVGGVYNVILRFLWQPKGLQQVVDELLHSVIPLLSILFWLAFVPKENLRWKNSFSWMIFPLCYTVFLAVRGAISGYYPYPFINVTNIGYPTVLLNGGILVLVFMGVFLFLIAVAKFISRKQL